MDCNAYNKIMENFRKIKQLNDRKKEKQYALSEMQVKKKLENKQSINPSLKESSIQVEATDSPYFVIKNLDNNKLQIYKDQNEIQH